MCVSTCLVDFENLSCFIFYYRGVDFRNSGEFSVLKKVVLLVNYYLGGKFGRDYFFSFSGLRGLLLINFTTTK